MLQRADPEESGDRPRLRGGHDLLCGGAGAAARLRVHQAL
jgi:hypothetical protein